MKKKATTKYNVKGAIQANIVMGCLILAVLATLIFIPKVSAHHEESDNAVVAEELKSVDEREKENIISNSFQDMANDHARLVAEMAAEAREKHAEAEATAKEEAARIEAEQAAAWQAQQQATYDASIWQAPQETYSYSEPATESIPLPPGGLPDWTTGIQSMGSYDSFIPY